MKIIKPNPDEFEVMYVSDDASFKDKKKRVVLCRFENFCIAALYDSIDVLKQKNPDLVFNEMSIMTYNYCKHLTNRKTTPDEKLQFVIDYMHDNNVKVADIMIRDAIESEYDLSGVDFMRENYKIIHHKPEGYDKIKIPDEVEDDA